MIRQLGTVVVSCWVAVSLFASSVGPEIVVKDVGAGSTPSVALSRDSSRTVLTWDESAGAGQLSRVMLHRHESRPGRGPVLGPQTFPVASSPHPQKSPTPGNGLVAWVEEEPTGSGIVGSVWYQPLEFWTSQTYAPSGPAEKIGVGVRDTKTAVVHYHVFHVIVWTGPDGRLMAAERQMITRLGHDLSPWTVTTDHAVNPASDGNSPSSDSRPLVAYLSEIPKSPPCSVCAPAYLVRATVLGGRTPQPSIYLTAPGTSAMAPDVVATGTDYAVFWSMQSGGTFGIRVATGSGAPVTVSGLEKIHDGELHDASIAPNSEMVMVVKEGERFLFLRLNRDLKVLESVPFLANLAAGARMKISADPSTGPMISYAAATGVAGQGSRIVYRLVDDAAPPPRKRRSAR